MANFNLKKNSLDLKLIKKQENFETNWFKLFSRNRSWCWIFFNVHEGPHAISQYNKVKLKEGMILSNEPGYYETNKFGIRIENLIYIKEKK